MEMIQLKAEDERKTIVYDCIECGRKDSVSVKENRGYCQTIGCLHGDAIQFVFHPNWQKPKASRAGREMWWLP